MVVLGFSEGQTQQDVWIMRGGLLEELGHMIKKAEVPQQASVYKLKNQGSR